MEMIKEKIKNIDLKDKIVEDIFDIQSSIYIWTERQAMYWKKICLEAI